MEQYKVKLWLFLKGDEYSYFIQSIEESTKADYCVQVVFVKVLNEV